MSTKLYPLPCLNSPSKIRKMYIGERATVNVAAKHAFGQEGLPPLVGPNEDVEYTLELVDFFRIAYITPDNLVVKKTLTQGSGWENPAKRSEVFSTPPPPLTRVVRSAHPASSV